MSDISDAMHKMLQRHVILSE